MGRIALFSCILLLSVAIAFTVVRTRVGSAPGAPALVVRGEHGTVTPRQGEPPNPPGSSPALPTEQHPTINNAEATALSVAACPEDMVFVAGAVCASLGHQCVRTSDQGCVEYASDPQCEGSRVELRFCMDRFEYPNQQQVVPAAMIYFEEAQRTCRAENKRLCREAEWTLACEGEERLPLPYGRAVRPDACNLGPRGESFDQSTAAEEVAAAVLNVDHRIPSGERAECVSSSGVADLIGNLQEWVVSPHPSYQGAVKGGHFSSDRASCRGVANIRHQQLRSPYSGFRCCAEPLIEVPRGSRASP